MYHRHNSRFLFVRGLTIVVLVGGLGVEDQQTGPPQIPIITACCIFFSGDKAKNKMHQSKPRTLYEQQQSIRDSFFFFAVPLECIRKRVELVSSRLQKRAKHWKIYICSPTIYTKFFNEWVYSSRVLAQYVSDLTGPSSGVFIYKLYMQIWYVVIRVLLDTSSRNGWTCRVVRLLPHTKSANTACKTLLMVDRWVPKHVELTHVMNKLTH